MTIKANRIDEIELALNGQLYRECPGSLKLWSETEDECGAKFCPVCEGPVRPYHPIDGRPQVLIMVHSQAALLYCACGGGIWDGSDYLCDRCRKEIDG